MSYDYNKQKHEVFKEENQKLFLGIRDAIQAKLKVSGAVTQTSAVCLPDGIGAASSFVMLACVDRLVELGELRKVENRRNPIYVSARD